MTNIILCGGSGTRLWPLSRRLMPKQFVKLFEDRSLFQLTVERNSKVCEDQYIVSNVEQYFLALDQLEELGKSNSRYLLEPTGRNTAPAIALACLLPLVLLQHLQRPDLGTLKQMVLKSRLFMKNRILKQLQHI